MNFAQVFHQMILIRITYIIFLYKKKICRYTSIILYLSPTQRNKTKGVYLYTSVGVCQLHKTICQTFNPHRLIYFVSKLSYIMDILRKWLCCKSLTMTKLEDDMGSSRFRNTRMIQNFHLVWLDENIDEDDNDCRRSITQLREIVNTVNTFMHPDECVNFIDKNKEEKTFLILSAAFGQTIVPLVHEKEQIDAIFILCNHQKPRQEWIQQWSKVVGVYTDFILICQALKQARQFCEHNAVSISLFKTTGQSTNEDLNTLDCSFMYTQILKEILLTMDFQQKHIDAFLTYSQKQLTGNSKELKNVEKVRQEYHDHQPIWWYTYDSFLYSMLNKALRSMEVDFLIKMGFFIRDLHNQLIAVHHEQYGNGQHSESFIVYRGQDWPKTDFDHLQSTSGGLLAFNNFTSTSLSRNVALGFTKNHGPTSPFVTVLFVMKIDSSISTTPFANVQKISYYRPEDEILFSMHSIFRIGQVQQLQEGNKCIWEVGLIQTNEDDPQLHQLTEKMREENDENDEGWLRLAKLFITIGQYDKAEELYNILLQQVTNEKEKEHLYLRLGMVKDHQQQYPEAIEYYEKSIAINQKILSPNHSELAICYNNIGGVYYHMGEYSKAFSFYGRALKIYQKTLPENHPLFAISYNNIGWMYDDMGEYAKALEYYEQVVTIQQQTLPPNHPDLGRSYNNIGEVYKKMGEYAKALSYHEQASAIRVKTLPANHPDLALSYNNIGLVYYSMGEYSKALSYYEQALEIRKKTLPEDHLDFATSYNSIAAVYFSDGDYLKALTYFEQALEIRKKALPVNYSQLATTYNNIGEVYLNINEYSNALSSHEKALEIYQKTLPTNHPLLAMSYSNIGGVYDNMGEHSKALSNYEQALQIQQKTLPENHPDIAILYTKFGTMYFKMKEYSKALSYYEQALEIQQKVLPENHPHLVTSYDNIGGVYSTMGDYSNAVLFHERAFEIEKKILPENGLQVAIYYNNIGSLYDKMGDHSKALSYYERALEIRKQILPENHLDFANSYNNIGFVYSKTKDYSNALLYLELALDIAQHSLPANHSIIENMKLGIETAKNNLG